jgi:hypothetical protein
VRDFVETAHHRVEVVEMPEFFSKLKQGVPNADERKRVRETGVVARLVGFIEQFPRNVSTIPVGHVGLPFIN